MSLRIEMLQVARVAPKALGESAELVRAFFLRQFTNEGGGSDRSGRPDLYYTIFALAGLQAMQTEAPVERIESYLRSFGDGEALDFVHLGALSRCWSAIGVERMPAGLAEALLARIEVYRSRDGGYDSDAGAEFGNAYGCFVALGAYQDLQRDLHEPLRMVQCLKFLETEDGAWTNARGMRVGSTNATAAAVTLLHQLNMPINASVGDWLLARLHPEGGFLAVPNARARMLDLALRPPPPCTRWPAWSAMFPPRQWSRRSRSAASILIDTPLGRRRRLPRPLGSTTSHLILDAEYTFYGLLALGHLTL